MVGALSLTLAGVASADRPTAERPGWVPERGDYAGHDDQGHHVRFHFSGHHVHHLRAGDRLILTRGRVHGPRLDLTHDPDSGVWVHGTWSSATTFHGWWGPHAFTAHLVT